MAENDRFSFSVLIFAGTKNPNRRLFFPRSLSN